MKLIFMRHGKAVDRSAVEKDEDRWLLPEAKIDIRRIIGVVDINIGRIFTSPYRRARETAEVVSSIINKEVIVSSNLAPEELNIDRLRELNPRDGDMFISHSPYIETVISDLVGGCRVKLKPSGLAIVDIDEIKPLAGTLIYLINPELIK